MNSQLPPELGSSAAATTRQSSVRKGSAPTYPTTQLLLVIGITSAVLIAAWTCIRVGWEFDTQVYRSGLIGLLAATTAHVVGTFVGSFLAVTQGSLMAYFASTVVRFLLTPTLALSLYFALPMQPKVLLIGAAAGYVVILAADIGTMLKASSRSNVTG